ncbi:hypothetical protein KKJ01_16805 [Xenorhabdus bovienii]|uniref:Uncharacterized protein n=1 Tax=Xenorhabdus bovienii TaxID=40576 RepID=A0AAJ1JBR2_XENBV|nr:hypothetical protein [Xenorhabdus bovienii]MDE1479842.1 hypothetical protein [Xenorhabdus bovienii]MDE9511452.1 hypothetical protein [Xenorhabdus bovienii]MDE9523109.1 hypothetical protein [Xenorhabdus bovienii]
MTWGGTDDRDDGILDDIGLSYMSFYHNLFTDKTYALINNKWREHHTKTINGYFEKFVHNHPVLIDDLVGEISLLDGGNKFSTPDIDTHIVIERNEVESLDTSKLHHVFEFATSSLPITRFLQGKIDITFNGYDFDDELYMIDDVRKFMRKVSDEINCLFFFINPNGISQILRYFFLSFTNINNQEIDSNGMIKLDLDLKDSKLFFEHQFNGLNELTERCNMSIYENKKITYAVFDCIGIPHS